METALVVNVSVLVRGQLQKICYGAAYHLSVWWVRVVARRLLHRRLQGRWIVQQASVIHGSAYIIIRYNPGFIRLALPRPRRHHPGLQSPVLNFR